MSDAMHLSRAEVMRRLVGQGIAALRAAAAADDAGRDVDAAAVRAVHFTEVDDEVAKHLLDVMNDHLERVERRSWYEAVLLASGASKALARWADLTAKEHGTNSRSDGLLMVAPRGMSGSDV
jgi:hypothetical protein